MSDPDTVSACRTVTGVTAVAVYTDVDDGVLVRTSLPVNAEPGEYAAGFVVTDLPPVERAAAIVHHGPMEQVMPVERATAAWIEASGYRSLGYPREVDLECPPDDHRKWVTELQVPVSPGGATPGPIA